MRIARAIIEGVEKIHCELVEFQSLITYIERMIEGKQFLLVLDDVWSEDYSKWEPFPYCLKSGHYSSKILVTTRKETVAHIIKSTDIISIKQLAAKECWLLFKRIVFSSKSKEECERLEEVGRKIVNKRKGLPLAIKTIGSLLHFRRTKEEWQRILYSDMWKLKEINKGLLAPLLLSYNDLPSVVKTCFLYCAVFSKEYNIAKDDLIKLWMAQGYLRVEQEEEMELLGEECFNILATRSFFQEFQEDVDGNIMRCKMHDIVHDFAQFLCRKECFTAKINIDCDEPLGDSFEEEICCHSMLIILEKNLFPIFIYRAKRLRSLLIDGKWEENSLFANALHKVFDELISLRALVVTNSFGSGGIKEIPVEIGKLIHLRYLNLSHQLIEKLPETLCELYDLQILDISWCRHVKELPQGIGKLINMRQFMNGGTSLTYMPLGIARLTSLQILKKFAVGVSVNGRQICSLESLKHLKLLQECCIYGLGNVSDVDEAQRLKLDKNIENLLVLDLLFNPMNEQERRKKEDDEELLEALKPTPNLTKLRIYDYRGKTWPTWMISLSNLRVFVLFDCKTCEHLPPLGKMSSLEEVSILRIRNLKRVGNEILGTESSHKSSFSSSMLPFPKLKFFQIYEVKELEEWDFVITGKEEIMPRLSELTIYGCPKLKALPHHLLQKTTLRDLQILRCPILKERYREETGQDWSKISHIPEIKIY